MGANMNVGDAIKRDDSGISRGSYAGFTLSSAYQPIYKINSLATADLLGYEGLLRPFMGDKLVNTADFLEGVVDQDRMFIESMCMALHIRNYPASASSGETLFVNVNASSFPGVEVMESEIFFTFSQLHKHGLSKDRIIFEIHNSAVVTPFVLVRICEIFKGNGYRFALDGFGEGHSNIERYLMLRPDIIKINRSMFVDSNRLRKVESLLSTLITAFQENGAEVLMEELETEEELRSAIDMGVNMIQGYHLGKPQMHPVSFEPELEITRDFSIPNLSVVSS